jgi:hypothetical protein
MNKSSKYQDEPCNTGRQSKNEEHCCPLCHDDDVPCLCDGLTDVEWEHMERAEMKYEQWKQWR